MQYDYNVGEIYSCNHCGLRVVVTVTAAPVQELSCCGEVMIFVETDLKPVSKSDQKPEYKVGDEYYCPVCGLECRILFPSSPNMSFSCCGVPMELK